MHPLPVTLQFVEEGRTWFFPVEFEGDKDRAWLVFDTGAAVSALCEEMATTSSVKVSLAPMPMSGIGGQTRTSTNGFHIPRMMVGGAALSGWTPRGIASEHLAPMGRRRIVGLMGQDVWKEFVVCIRPRERQVVLHAPGVTPPADVEWLPVVRMGHLVVITASWNGQSGRFVVDTGAEMDVLLGNFAGRIRVKEQALKPLARAMTMGVGGPELVEATVLESMAVGSWRLKRPEVHISRRPGGQVDGILGHRLVSSVVTWWDGAGNRLGIQPYPDAKVVEGDGYEYERLALVEAMMRRDMAHLAEGCRKLRERFPMKTELGSQEAVALFQIGKPEEAMTLIRRLLQERPGDPHLLLAKANIHHWQDQLKEYLEITEEVVKTAYPDDRELLVLRAKAYRQLKDYPHAIETASLAARLYPWDTDLKKILDLLEQEAQP